MPTRTFFEALLLMVGACGPTLPMVMTEPQPQPVVDAGTATGDTPDAGATQDAGVTLDAGVTSGTSGCQAVRGQTGFFARTVMVGGVERRYQVFVPATYDGRRPLALGFVFHGLGGNGDQIRAYLSLETQAGGAAVFVYPDGRRQAAAGGSTAWAEDDLLFFDAMTSALSADYCLDPARIFATGHSYGGYMTNLVGCERGDVVRAIAPVSGGFVAANPCRGHVAAWVAHGDADNVVPLSEGTGARDHWLAANTCSAMSQSVSPAPCIRYTGCQAGYDVEWCQFSGAHYPLPDFTQQAIWTFFAAQTPPQ